MKTKKIKPTLEITVNTLSHDGRGIAQIEGKTLFISGALANERVKCHILKRRGSFDEAEVTEVLVPSPERVTPRCQHFGVCGGCSLQHMQEETQIQLKENTLLEQLKHSAQTTPQDVLPRMTTQNWGYRKKARLGIKYVPGKNKVLVGFREKNSRFIANLLRCEVLDASVGLNLENLSAMLYTLKARDKIPQIEVAIDDTSTALIFRHLVELCQEDQETILQFAKQFNYKIYLQPKGIDSIHPLNTEPLLHYKLPDYHLTLAFHPAQFTQVNSDINKKMIAQALTLLDIQAEDLVLDLFCGIGNFTLPLATRCQQVIGVEGDSNAVQQAKENAAHNNINNAEFYCDNLFEPSESAPWSKLRFNKLLLDPPRSGAKEIIPLLASWPIEKIVYVSCNPATLARDTGLILEQGYTLAKAGVMDMFPHTKHVESIALFTKKR